MSGSTTDDLDRIRLASERFYEVHEAGADEWSETFGKATDLARRIVDCNSPTSYPLLRTLVTWIEEAAFAAEDER